MYHNFTTLGLTGLMLSGEPRWLALVKHTSGSGMV